MDRKNIHKREGKHVQRHAGYSPPMMGLVGTVLTGVALWDLSHRPAAQVKGKKWVWALVSCAQPIGPIVYLLFGRQRPAAS
jgi:Phospholipase_D-nuclease N-terminal